MDEWEAVAGMDVSRTQPHRRGHPGWRFLCRSSRHCSGSSCYRSRRRLLLQVGSRTFEPLDLLLSAQVTGLSSCGSPASFFLSRSLT